MTLWIRWKISYLIHYFPYCWLVRPLPWPKLFCLYYFSKGGERSAFHQQLHAVNVWNTFCCIPVKWPWMRLLLHTRNPISWPHLSAIQLLKKSNISADPADWSYSYRAGRSRVAAVQSIAAYSWSVSSFIFNGPWENSVMCFLSSQVGSIRVFDKHNCLTITI